jgi:lysyl-tRNA synthetase, class II
MNTDEQAIRTKKLDAMRAAGIDPYPARLPDFPPQPIENIRETFDDRLGQECAVAGRIRLVRGHGKSIFVNVSDASGSFQLFVKEDQVGEASFQQWNAWVDIGDFVYARGTLMKTKTGEQTVLVTSWTLLSKTLRPLADKHHGLADTESRYRHRELDLIANPESLHIAKTRAMVVRCIRDFFERDGYIEVETPILQIIPGGTNARPFATHHSALDLDMYLRIAPELYLKRLVVGGMDKVFEIARCFRNEGISPQHNPEFTQVEAYEAYADYGVYMERVEVLMRELVLAVHGKESFSYHGDQIDVRASFPRVRFRDLVLEHAGVDIDAYGDVAELRAVASDHIAVAPEWGEGKILDELYKETARPKLVQPTFLIDHPVSLLPLAKRKADDPRYVESFQLVLGGGIELVKAFSELNDPIDQRQRFEEQEALREAGDDEAQHLDEAYLEALEYGLPPTAGLGLGIDRLVSILTDAPNLKEVILFPTMRPVHEEDNTEKTQ